MRLRRRATSVREIEKFFHALYLLPMTYLHHCFEPCLEPHPPMLTAHTLPLLILTQVNTHPCLKPCLQCLDRNTLLIATLDLLERDIACLAYWWITEREDDCLHSQYHLSKLPGPLGSLPLPSYKPTHYLPVTSTDYCLSVLCLTGLHVFLPPLLHHPSIVVPLLETPCYVLQSLMPEFQVAPTVMARDHPSSNPALIPSLIILKPNHTLLLTTYGLLTILLHVCYGISL